MVDHHKRPGDATMKFLQSMLTAPLAAPSWLAKLAG
jgi:hypothetical protein